MKPTSIAARWIACLAIVGIAGSQGVSVAAAADPASTVTDVALRDGGVLIGQVVSPQGVAKAQVPVTIRLGKQTLAVGATDQRGYFAFGQLPGGVYQITASESQGTYRVWTRDAAPPSAQPGALLVDGNEIVRGAPLETVRFYASNPWVWGTAAAAGIGVGTYLIIDNNNHPHSN